MRGETVLRVYGLHEGRVSDSFFGAFRTRAEAERQIRELQSRTMHGENWADKYHNRGFVIREHVVETDFEIPPRPRPRERYVLRTKAQPNAPGTWDSTVVEVCRRTDSGDPEPVCTYVRNHALFQTFEPFRQGNREYALISRDYTRTAVLDLSTFEVIAEEVEETPGCGFCPVGFYVPDWWDVHDGSVIPGSEYWRNANEWPVGDFGFVWGCYWGDDSSWKVQLLDLGRLREGVIVREERFGYLELGTSSYISPCFKNAIEQGAELKPNFIEVHRGVDSTRVRLLVELGFDLGSGQLDSDQRERLLRDDAP